MKRKMKFISLLVLSLVLLASTTASATLILDQSQTLWDSSFRVSTAQFFCQTFTAGMSGQLVGVNIRLATNHDQLAPATISIIGTTAGVPDDNQVLWTHDYDVLAQGWFSVDTSTGAPSLTAGGVYGIKFTSTDVASGSPDDYWSVAYITYPDPYASGQFFANRGSGWTTIHYPNADATFETYMIPEPAMIALLSLGSLVLLPLRRK